AVRTSLRADRRPPYARAGPRAPPRPHLRPHLRPHRRPHRRPWRPVRLIITMGPLRTTDGRERLARAQAIAAATPNVGSPARPLLPALPVLARAMARRRRAQ